MEEAEPRRYKITGAILSVIDDDGKKFKYTIDERFPNDPWVASVSISPLTKPDLMKFHKSYRLDPDKKGVPYYFVVENIISEKEFVMFSFDETMYPIDEAKKVGVKKGLDPKQLDFEE